VDVGKPPNKLVIYSAKNGLGWSYVFVGPSEIVTAVAIELLAVV